MRATSSYILSFLLWPMLLGTCIAITHVGMMHNAGILAFNGAYIALAGSLFFLERARPHETQWLLNCGQIIPDLLHTLVTKGVIQIMVIVATVMGVAAIANPASGRFWPENWPLAAQIFLALAIAEIGLYWAHRLAHQWTPLWRFHAVHHSVTRLWFFNTGRFHFVDTSVSIILSQPLLFIAGAPKDMFLWVSAITAFIGMLTHCNVNMRFGPISYVFNTPALHRWHHSMKIREGNKNYGENLMIFDLIFGTYFDADRRPPSRIGVREDMPKGFLGQIAFPFRKNPLDPSLSTPYSPPIHRRGVEQSGSSSGS